MALDELRERITQGASVVHDAAERLKDGIESQHRRQRLEDELDTLFAELGVLVYQRLMRGDPIEESVVVQDLVDRIGDVEEHLAARPSPEPA